MVTVADIQRAVCEQFGVRMIEMSSHRRARCVARPRQVAMYLARELTQLSLPAIGQRFGNRDHTTVLHACRIVPEVVRRDTELAAAVAELERRLASSPEYDPNQLKLPIV